MSVPTARGQRTYWHLLGQRRMPTRYEVVSSRLLYYPDRGFEVETPLVEWYRRYQQGSSLRSDDWERFADPEATTYASYTERQARREALVQDAFERTHVGYPDPFEPEWRALLERVVAPLRYPVHALQMVSAYLAQLAPSGRITIAAMFQAADEMRRVQTLARWLGLSRLGRPGFGEDAREVWEQDPLWQPTRRLIEHLLVCWDWGECFAALNLTLKPRFDALLGRTLADAARVRGDVLLTRLLDSLAQDAAWHDVWAQALVECAVQERPENRAVLDHWVEKWRPDVDAACAALRPLLGQHAEGP